MGTGQVEPFKRQVSRRSVVVGSGAKLAYASPLVAASFSLSPTFGYVQAAAYFEKKKKQNKKTSRTGVAPRRTRVRTPKRSQTQPANRPAIQRPVAPSPRAARAQRRERGAQQEGQRGQDRPWPRRSLLAGRCPERGRRRRERRSDRKRTTGRDQAGEDQGDGEGKTADGTGGDGNAGRNKKSNRDKTGRGNAGRNKKGNRDKTGRGQDGPSSPDDAPSGGGDGGSGDQTGSEQPGPDQAGEDQGDGEGKTADGTGGDSVAGGGQGNTGRDEGSVGSGDGGPGDSEPEGSAGDGPPSGGGVPDAGGAPDEDQSGGAGGPADGGGTDPIPPPTDDSLYLPTNDGDGHVNDVPTPTDAGGSEAGDTGDDPKFSVAKVVICHAVCTKKDPHRPLAYTLIELADDPDAWDMHVVPGPRVRACARRTRTSSWGRRTAGTRRKIALATALAGRSGG